MRENKWNVVIAEKKTDTNVRMMKLSNSSPRSLRERTDTIVRMIKFQWKKMKLLNDSPPEGTRIILEWEIKWQSGVNVNGK